MVSIPFFNVTVDDGHPLHAPCKRTFTSPLFLSKDWNIMLPPSWVTAGLIYSSISLAISFDVSSNSFNEIESNSFSMSYSSSIIVLPSFM